MAVTPKNGLGKYGPARSYERTVATIKFRSYWRTSSSLVFCQSAPDSADDFRKQRAQKGVSRKARCEVG